MKTLITDYLQHRLPANQNFLLYINEEMNSYLKAYCSSLYPDSDSKAYVLFGCERTGNVNTINYSSGLVFYKGELFHTPTFSHSAISDNSPGFILQKNVINEEYANGQSFPTYESNILVWNNYVYNELAFGSLLRREFSIKELITLSTLYEIKEAKTVNNNSTQTLILRLKLQNAAIASNFNATVTTNFTKSGFIGFGKMMNRTTGYSCDICVYQIGATTVFTRPSDPEPTVVNNALPKWSDICAYSNFVSGQDVMLYVNLTHERV